MMHVRKKHQVNNKTSIFNIILSTLGSVGVAPNLACSSTQDMREIRSRKDEEAEFTRDSAKWWVNMDTRKGMCEDKRLEGLAVSP